MQQLELLKRFEGSWRIVDDHHAGTETSRLLSDNWLVMDAGLTYNGELFRTLATIGFDEAKGEFVGTWIGSMMPQMWFYRDGGSTENSIVLLSEGPDWEDPTIVRTYRDSYIIEADGSRSLRSAKKDDDGSWNEFMNMRYERI